MMMGTSGMSSWFKSSPSSSSLFGDPTDCGFGVTDMECIETLELRDPRFVFVVSTNTGGEYGWCWREAV